MILHSFLKNSHSNKIPPSLFSPALLSLMVPELEKLQVTELYVRMDCNGCVQKIKKALHGVNGIYDSSIDFSQQKVTVRGWIEPEKIIRAIKKTKKVARICSHNESTDSTPQPTEPPPPEAAPPGETETASPAEPPPAETTPPTEPPKEEEPPPPPPENQTSESQPPSQENPPTESPKEEIHVIHHHHSGDGYGNFWNDQRHWNNYPSEPEFRSNQQPTYITSHSYNTHKPSPYTSEYYRNTQEPPRYTNYTSVEHQHHGRDYQNYEVNNGGSNITSMFSDENPNACRIV